MVFSALTQAIKAYGKMPHVWISGIFSAAAILLTYYLAYQECSNSGLSNREFCRQRGISEKTYYYWLRKLRSQMAESAVPQLVQLESAPVPIQDDMLQIQYRGAELKLPAGVDMDAVAALLRSLQSL